MHSIFKNPPEELRRFSIIRGGFPTNYQSPPSPDRNLAHEYLDVLADCYEGSENEVGEKFTAHAQISASSLRNAVFTKYNRRLLILYDEGLMRLIDEIVLMCITAKFRSFEKFYVGDYFHLFAQKEWRGVGSLKGYDTAKIKTLVKDLKLGTEYTDFANVLTNLILIFVLSHEFTHAVNGHSVLLGQSSGDSIGFLGETQSEGVIKPDKWSLVAEISADFVSLQRLLTVSDKTPFELRGEFYQAKMPCVLASLYMLYSHWFVEAFEHSGFSLYKNQLSGIDMNRAWDKKHPMSTDRIALLMTSLYDANFGERIGHSNIAHNSNEALDIFEKAIPHMTETAAVRLVAGSKDFYLDRAYRQKQLLGKDTLPEFLEVAKPYKFPLMKEIEWD